MTTHLRFDDSRPRHPASECVCGEPGCTLWYDDALTLNGWRTKGPQPNEKPRRRGLDLRESGVVSRQDVAPASVASGQGGR